MTCERSGFSSLEVGGDYCWWMKPLSKTAFSPALNWWSPDFHQQYQQLEPGIFSRFFWRLKGPGELSNRCRRAWGVFLCFSILGLELGIQKQRRWWFQRFFFIFTPTLGKWSNLTSIFFKWVETTNEQRTFFRWGPPPKRQPGNREADGCCGRNVGKPGQNQLAIGKCRGEKTCSPGDSSRDLFGMVKTWPF